MKTAATLFIAFAIASLLPSSAAAQNREHQQMAAEVRMLQEQTQQLSQALQQALKGLGEVGESVKQLNESLKKVDARLDAADSANRKSLADQKLSFDSMSSDLRIVREGTQNMNTRIGILTEEVEALSKALPTLTAPTTLPPTDGSGSSASPIATLPSVPTPTATARSGVSANRLFQTAFGDYTTGEYRMAITGFQQVLDEWPKSEQADDALFYMGGSYMAQKKYVEAAKAFSDLIANYPTGDKVPDAYVDLGQAQRAMNQLDAARTTWETVRTKYPSSSSAIIARERLEGLPPATPQKP